AYGNFEQKVAVCGTYAHRDRGLSRPSAPVVGVGDAPVGRGDTREFLRRPQVPGALHLAVGCDDGGRRLAARPLVIGQAFGEVASQFIGQHLGVDDRLRRTIRADRYIGCAASPSSVTRPSPHDGRGSRSTIGYSRIIALFLIIAAPVFDALFSDMVAVNEEGAAVSTAAGRPTAGIPFTEAARERLRTEPLSPMSLACMATAYGHLAPGSYNRVVATLGSLFAYTTRQGTTPTSPATTLERRRLRTDRHDHARTRAIPEPELLAFLTAEHPLRDKTLWWLLYDTAARASEILALDVDHLDLPRRRAVVIGKDARAERVGWETKTARILPRLLQRRRHGPVFLAAIAPAPARQPTLADLDPETGRARLSYRRAAEVFQDASGSWTLPVRCCRPVLAGRGGCGRRRPIRGLSR
ncbi:MAG: tyrosine-type recombinase/integrase, partial [Pseudonocardiaceae bacterium]